MESILLSNDEKRPLDYHLAEFSFRFSIILLLIVILTVIWSFSIDTLLSAIMQQIDPCENACMNVFKPAEWTGLRWLSAGLLGIISSGPFLIHQMHRFSRNGLFPNERNWFVGWLICGWLFSILILYFITWHLAPFLYQLGHQFQSGIGLDAKYDATESLSLVIGLSWLFLTAFLSFSALIFASKFHLLHRENADWWRLRVYGLTILMIWAVLPPSSPGIWIATAAAVIVVLEFISQPLMNQSPLLSREIKELMDEEGGIRRMVMVDCHCDGGNHACSPSEGMGHFSSPGICQNPMEQDRLLETIRNAAATDIIISGCDGEPLPINLKQNLAMLKVQYRGLDLMRVHASRTQTCAHPMLDRDIQLASLESPWSRNKVLENIRDTIKEHPQIEFLYSPNALPFGTYLHPNQSFIQADLSPDEWKWLTLSGCNLRQLR